MTNLEKIKTLGAIEMADLLQNKPYCAKCSFNKGFDSDGNWICGSDNAYPYESVDECTKGCRIWLETEAPDVY